MIIKYNVSFQDISWVKSNKRILTSEISGRVKRLFYPENLEEFEMLIKKKYHNNESFDLIAYSSNTLFWPSYTSYNMVCTKRLDTFKISGNVLLCDPGVRVRNIVKFCIANGFKGFEGLIDLPGAIASAVYGNCGCFGYLINDKLLYIELIKPNGDKIRLDANDLKLGFRTTALKRKEIIGTIYRVALDISEKSKTEELQRIADEIHKQRINTQPSAANNLGTSILVNTNVTSSFKGRFFNTVWNKLDRLFPSNDKIIALKLTFILFGKYKFVPYIWNLYRFMFYDEKSHLVFIEYVKYIRNIYPDSHLEIEIKK